MSMKSVISTGLLAAGFAATLSGSTMVAAEGVSQKALDEGKAIAFNKKKGNCLACHRIEGGRMAGDIAPPILMMKMRYPDKADLRAQIWDATRTNPNTVMPPFGRHKIMSESEIDKVTDFIYSL